MKKEKKKLKHIGARIPIELHERIERYSKEHYGFTKSHVLKMALKEFLDKREVEK